MTSTTSLDAKKSSADADQIETSADEFSEKQLRQLQEVLQSMLDPIHQRLDAIEEAIGLPAAPKTKTPTASTMNSLMGKFSALSTKINCQSDKTSAASDATEKQNKEKLKIALSSLAHLFRGTTCPSGKFVMDPLSCIVTGGDFGIEADHWWSSLSYEYNIGDANVVGDVLPVFGCYLDLYPRATTSNKMEKYGDNIVNVYVPTNTVKMLKRQVQKLTGHAVEYCVDEIVDENQGLTAFLALTAPEDDSTVKVAIYNSEVDENGEVVETQRKDYSLGRLYMSAARNPDATILGGVAMLHANATFSCAPNAYENSTSLPSGIVVELSIKLSGFHCLGVATDFVEQITSANSNEATSISRDRSEGQSWSSF